MATPNLLDDRFQLFKQFSEGGYGKIYKGFDFKEDREIIIKFIEKEESF